MIALLLKLLGVSADRAEKIVKIVPTVHGQIPMWLIVLLAMALTGVVFWMYHRAASNLSLFRRCLLASLRSLFLIMLLLILVQPILSITVAGTVRQSLLLLIDSSSSMQIKDIRDTDSDIKRAAIAKAVLEPSKGFRQNLHDLAGMRDPARMELVKAVFRNDKLDLLKRVAKDYDVEGYAFDRDLKDMAITKTVPGAGAAPKAIATTAPAASGDADKPVELTAAQIAAQHLDWINAITANGSATALGDSLTTLLTRKQGQPVAGIWVITDGGNNTGSLPVEAAKMAKEYNMPLYIYGVGITSPKDIIVGHVFAPEVAFVKDEIPVTVRVRAQGLKGQHGTLVLKYKNAIVDRKDVSFDDELEQAISLKFTPEEVGEGDLQASIDPRSDEVVKENNYSAPKHLRVTDGRIKVLQIETLPRWEFKYLQAMLMRDRRVDYKCMLLDGDPAITEGDETPYMKEFPNLGDLAKKFDVVILGDVDPKRLTPQNLKDINQFVSESGGSLIMLAGRRFSPSAYRRTPIEKMLPVEFESSENFTVTLADKPVKLELTAAGKQSPMLRLSDKDQESLTKWAQLPPIYWECRVLRPKPAAEVLLVDADAGKASRFGKMPVIALQQYGSGHVLFVGTDNTWRWRKNTGESVFQTFWTQSIEQLANAHLLGGSKRTQLSLEREKYATGDRITLYARLYRESNFEPMSDPTVRGFFRATSGVANPDAAKDEPVTLRQLPDQPGMYRAEFIAPAVGTYSFRVETDSDTKLNFTVADPKLEMGETALNEPLLRDMAEKSGGQFFREEDLNSLPDQIKSTSQPVYSTFDVELWCSPIYFALLVAVVTAEWILRKLAQLK